MYSTAQFSGVSKTVPTTEILIISLIMKVDISTSIGESKVLTDEEQSCGLIFAHIPHIFVAQSLSTPGPGQGECLFSTFRMGELNNDLLKSLLRDTWMAAFGAGCRGP